MKASSGSASDDVGGYPSLSFGLFFVDGSRIANGDRIADVGAASGLAGSFPFWLDASARNVLVSNAVTRAMLLMRREMKPRVADRARGGDAGRRPSGGAD